MTKDVEEERRAGDMIRQELESQLEAKVLEVQNALTHSTELEERLKATENEISELKEILVQATIEKEAERVGFQCKVSELEGQLACTDAEKDDYATRASALGEDLRFSEQCLAEAHSRIAELEKAFIDERERSHTTLAEAHEQLVTVSAARSQAVEQAELLISEVQRLQNELAQLQTKHDEMHRSKEELRLGAEASIDELRKLVASASSEKDSALNRCLILEEQSNCMIRTLETTQLSAEDLHASLVELEQKYNGMEADFHDSRIREEHLSEQCEALQLECTNLQQEVEDLHHQNVELESFLRDTQDEGKRQQRELGNENREILAEKAILEAMVAAKEESLLSLHSNNTSLRTQVTAKEIEKSDLVNRVGVLSNELDMMRLACVSVEATVKKLENNESSLAREFASLKERHDDLMKTHHLQTDENETLLERLSLLMEEKTEIERFLSAAEEESSTLCEENAALEGKLSEQRETLAALELSSTKATEARDGLQVKLENLQDSMHSMAMEIREVHEELDRRDAERVEMECRVMSLETEKMAALAENDSFQVNQHEQMQVLEDQIAENDEYLDQLSRENRDFAEKCDEYDRHVKHLQSEVDELRTTREVATSKERQLADQVGGLIDDLEGARCSIAALESDNLALRHQIQEMENSCKAEIQTFEAELSASKEANEKADRALQRCQTDLEGLRTSRDKAVNSLRDREQERDKAVAAMEDLYQKHQELSKHLGTALCGEKRSALEKEIVDLRQSSLELRHLLASTTGSEGRLREKLAAAESEVLSKTRALEDSQYRLSLVEEELRQSELAYEQKLAADPSGNISLQERQDLLGEIDSLKSILNHERDDRKAAEDDLKRQMGEEQRLLIQEGEKIMAEMRVKICDLERSLAESQHEAYTSRQQLDELQDEKQSTDRACQELQRTMQDIELSLTRKEVQLSSLQEELSKAKSESYSLKENAVELKEKAKYDGRNIERLERENAMAISELALLKRQISAIEKVKGEVETECDRLTAQMKVSSKNTIPSPELASQVRHLQIALQKREDTIKQQESAIESIRRESSSSVRMAEELERLKTKIAEKDQRIIKLQKFKLTKEFAEEHKQLKKDNARLREELLNVQSEMESTGSDSALRTEVSELRFDKDALETKLRKFAAHCQRLEDDKVGVMDALRSCNIKLNSYDEVNDAVVSLCDQLASLQESISVASRGSPGRTQELERENQALQMKLDRVAASEERLAEQVARFQKERDELLRKLKAVSDNSDSENATSSDVSSKLRYLEQENLQLMYDVKTTKKQLQAAREEIEVLRLNSLDNSTLVFGTVDLQSIASSEGSKTSSNQASALRSTAKKAHLSDKTNDFLNISSGKLSNKLPYGENGDKNDKATIHSSAPGLGEVAVQGDETGECNQS
jgi:chromosome segregation ATPase